MKSLSLKRRMRAGMAVGLVGLVTAVASPASADTAVQQAVTAFKHGATVYAAPAAIGHPLSPADIKTLKRTVARASSPFYLAVLGEPHHQQAQVDLHTLVDAVHADATYIVVGTGGFVARIGRTRGEGPDKRPRQ